MDESWSSVQANRAGPNQPAQISQPHPSLFLLTSSCHSILSVFFQYSVFFQANLEVQFPPEVQELGEFKAGPGDVAMLVAKIRAFPGLANISIFSVYFLQNNYWFPWGANQWPLVGETLFSFPSNLLCLHLRPLKGFLSWRGALQRALDSPRALFPELQRNMDTIRCALLGNDVIGHRQNQLAQTLIVRLLKLREVNRKGLC